ncbi:MAG: hypothetical protein JRI25_15700, partial [Deltaproteobacteria bacterium]|nr:hypothetical protein [Deltaproteobacteria bacterium]
MNRTTDLFRSGLVTALVLVATPALANPIASDVLLARQAPHTHHVQITLGRYTSDDDLEEPTAVTRDDDAIDPDWVELDDSYETNTGSGVTDVDAIQF